MYNFSLSFLANSSFCAAITQYWSIINGHITETLLIIRDKSDSHLVPIFDSLPVSVYFDEFQLSLLKIFTFILIVNLVLIFVAWKLYGKHICDRFMKPATNKAIEELKASVSKLKLPKEHTPRI